MQPIDSATCTIGINDDIKNNISIVQQLSSPHASVAELNITTSPSTASYGNDSLSSSISPLAQFFVNLKIEKSSKKLQASSILLSTEDDGNAVASDTKQSALSLQLVPDDCRSMSRQLAETTQRRFPTSISFGGKKSCRWDSGCNLAQKGSMSRRTSFDSIPTQPQRRYDDVSSKRNATWDTPAMSQKAASTPMSCFDIKVKGYRKSHISRLR